MKDLHLRILALSLTACGLAIFLYKAFFLGFPLVPQTKSFLWDLEAKVEFLAHRDPVKVSLFVPGQSRHFAIVRENFISRGFGIRTLSKGDNRRAVWSIRRAQGEQVLYYRALVRQIEERAIRLKAPPPKAEEADFTGAYLEAAEALLSDIRERSADLDSLVAELAKRLNNKDPGDIVGLLLGEDVSLPEKAGLAVRLLVHAGFPARMVHGISLNDPQRDVPLVQWIEVLDGKAWRPFNILTGEEGVRSDYLAWWRGEAPLIRADGVENVKVTISVAMNQEEAIKTAMSRGRIKRPILLDFSLFSLPVGTQAVYRVLFLLPVGALLVVFIRNVLGVKTFGTFMPILIALAFRETNLLWGLILFTLIVSLGLGIRLYFERLKLLVVPRLAAVLIVVVVIMAALSVLTHRLGLEKGLSVALFPMVIMTMTIERMSIIWEELGPMEALQQGLGSLLVAALAYLVMNLETVQHLVFVFPELTLVMLAASLMLGRYSGYRLMELLRFKALIEKGNDV